MILFSCPVGMLVDSTPAPGPWWPDPHGSRIWLEGLPIRTRFAGVGCSADPMGLSSEVVLSLRSLVETTCETETRPQCSPSTGRIVDRYTVLRVCTSDFGVEEF